MWRHLSKFCRLGDQAHGVCVALYISVGRCQMVTSRIKCSQTQLLVFILLRQAMSTPLSNINTKS